MQAGGLMMGQNFIALLANGSVTEFLSSLVNIVGRLAGGLGMSFLIFVLTLVFSLPLGLLIAFGRMAKNKLLSGIVRVYISIMRGTPLMLQLMVIFFGPHYLFKIPLTASYRYVAVIIGFSLNYAAYFAEIYRAGIESISVGQYEAANVLGYSKGQTFFRIIFPQVVKRIIPPVTNEVITLVKDTSLAFVIAVSEMFTIAKQIVAAQGTVVPLIVAGLFYYIFNYVVAYAMERVEKKFSYFRYDVQVLKDISITVEEGEVVAIIGPSGSGKSTLLRCATLLETMDSGTLAYQGEYAVSADAEGNAVYASAEVLRDIRKKFGLVFQNFNLFPHMTVLQNVMDAPVHVQKRDKAEVETEARALLEKMGLADKADAYPYQLSGGQQQRVSIARAMAMKPAMLFFDEPTSALDPELTGEILKVLRTLAAEHMTMVIVTHEINFAKNVADRVIFMADGYIVEEGRPEDVIDNSSSERLRSFLNKMNEE